ncbi:hypothetical protein [Streptomyces sp. NPDC050535]|uniref:hypothetical protein n=1 Tax=Streptomyces sp. NPDC050535 TaxID=3365626 RepID=UPI00378E9566
MVSLPPDLRAHLYFDGAWNDISRSLRATAPVTFTRGLTSESASEASPMGAECVLDNRSNDYSPRNPRSRLKGKIGRNTPIRLGYRVGSPWVNLPGTNGNEITTPTNAAYNVTDVDLRLDLALDDWATGQGIAARYTASGNNRSWGVYLAGTGQIAFVWSPTGTSTTITQFSTVPVIAYNGQRLTLHITLDVDNGASGYELRFYTGRTVDDEEWELLGDPIVGVGTTAVFAASSGVEFGDFLGLVVAGMTGKAFALKLMSGILGTAVLAMTTADAAPGAASFTSNGAVWTTTTGATLTNHHIRMAGEVPAWPPSRDLTGNDRTVTLAPAGVTRRMDAGNKPIDSAMLRFLKTRSPIECWPLTDGEQTGTAGKSLLGGSDMRTTMSLGTDIPEWGSGTLADWIEPVVTLKGETAGVIAGGVPNSAAAAAFWSVDFLYKSEAPGNAGVFEIRDRGAGTDADNVVFFTLSLDTVDNDITIFRASRGDTSSSSSLLTSVTDVGIYDGNMHHIRFSVDPGVSSSVWTIYVDGVQKATGTVASIVVKAVRSVSYSWSLLSGGGISGGDQQLGYVTYWDGTGPTAAQVYDAATGHQGERAGARIERLAAESGYTASVAGMSEYQTRLGIQRRRKLLELLNEASRSNVGYLLDRRDAPEVIHRGHSTLWNQPPAITLDFKAGLISSPFKPDDGDKLTENDVSVRREGGQVPSRQILDEGALSVQDPPDGVGRYDQEHTYSLYEDSQAAQLAYLRLHLGTYDGVRYARITLDLANSRVHQMIDAILRADCGDKIRLTGLPDDHGPDDVDVLINGYTEEAGPTAWKITFNCTPAEPWTALVIGSTTYARIDTAGCELAEVLDTTETGVDVLTTALYRWVDSATYPTDFPFDVKTGGEVMRVTACTGTTLAQTFTVVRGVNGVRIEHPTGQDIRLANPVYIPL